MDKLKIPDNFVTYIPGSKVAKLKEPSLIISIKGRYDSRPDISSKHTVLRMDFDVGDWAVDANYGLKEEQLDEMLAFLEENKGRNLYIHCTEGRCRSFTVAKLLRQALRMYYIEDIDGLTGPGGMLDRPTCHTFHRWLEAREAAKAETPAEPALDAPA